MARLHIGTSGWHYGHWRGRFYPRDMKSGDYLAHYARSFSSVEINATFYRTPDTGTVRAWHDAVPKDFVFACKASRFTTHMKKLKDPVASSQKFFAAIAPLEEKCGPVLFQLPPRWRVNAERLASFLAELPKHHAYAFEFRDRSWFTSEVYALLERHGAALCLYDLAGWRSPIVETAGFVYVRLHGPGAAYQGSYDGRTLAGWVKRAQTWRAQGRDVYIYFDNDEKAYAVGDALRAHEMASGD